MAAVDEVDVYDSWEDMDELGLDRKITKFLAANPNQCTEPAKISNGGSATTLFDMNDSMGGQIMGKQQQPCFKILKRPSAGVNGMNSNGEGKARPVKTLQQRKQEYEQARLRILGEARCPEDEENITNLQIKMEANGLQTINRIKEKPSTESNTNTPDNILAVQPRIISQQPPNLINLIREPKGPDGSKGFHLRR